MAKLKSERHHWWPECVSRHWADDSGLVHCMFPDGKVVSAPPKNFGVIGNGHTIKLSREPGESTPWDENFEHEFNQADNGFPATIEWLQQLTFEDRQDAPLRTRFVAQSTDEIEVARLLEAAVSLVVRSPRLRERAVSVAEHYRGPLPERERNTLIGSNLRRGQRDLVNCFGTRAKFCAIHSPDREFVFGDGCFSNLSVPAQGTIAPRLIVPVTPRISVLITRPLAYTSEPRLTTLVLSSDEAGQLNDAVQVYSRKFVFYRSERPTIIDAFEREEHLIYASLDNPMEKLVAAVPGVPERKLSSLPLYQAGGR
jgi:hypothetical protein